MKDMTIMLLPENPHSKAIGHELLQMGNDG